MAVQLAIRYAPESDGKLALNMFKNITKYEFGFGLMVGSIMLLPYQPLFGLEILYWLVLVIFLFTFFSKRLSEFRILSVYMVPFLLFALSGFLKAIYFSGDPKDDLLDLATNMHVFILTLCIYNYFKNKAPQEIAKHVEVFTKVVTFSLLMACFVGIAQFIKFKPVTMVISELYELKYTHRLGHEFTNFGLSEKLSRVNSIYATPIAFSGILGLLLILIQGVRTINIYLTLIFLITIVLTNARMVTFVVFSFVVVQNYEKFGLARIIGVLLLLMIGGFFMVDYLGEGNISRFTELFDYVASGFDKDLVPHTGETRLRTMETILDYFEMNGSLLWGMNLNDFNSRLKGYSLESQYFAWVVKYGVVGMAITIWSFYMVIYYRRKNSWAINLTEARYFQSLVYVFLAMILINITQQIGFGRHLREVLFIFIGLAEAYSYSIRRHHEHRTA